MQLAKNILLLMVEDCEVGIIGVDDDNKIVKKLLLISTNLNKATRYLTLKAKLAFTIIFRL